MIERYITYILFWVLVIAESKLAVLSFIIIYNCFLIYQKYTFPFTIDVYSVILWCTYLFSSFISTCAAPDFYLSFFGHFQLQDGWLFWLLIFLFYITNQHVAKLPYQLFSQQQGILFALFCNNIFTLFHSHHAGYFSHRGVNAIFTVTALTIFQSRLKLAPLTTFVIFLTGNRIAAIARILLLPRKYWFLIFIPLIFFVRHINYIPGYEQFFSGRIYRYYLSQIAFLVHPYYGWGFDGFHHAMKYLGYSYSYKAHNFFLDLLVDLGFCGTFSYLSLLIYLISKLSFDTIKPIAIYFFCIYFWYDCAELTWLLFWYLSIYTLQRCAPQSEYLEDAGRCGITSL